MTRAADLLQLISEDVLPVLRATSDSVDREARVPTESLTALARTGLLRPSSQDSERPLEELSEITELLAGSCGATAMIFAMHHSQLASVRAHAGEALRESTMWKTLESDAVTASPTSPFGLIASVTSEVGTGGDISRSVASIDRTASGLSLTKNAPTISYASAASMFLVSVRGSADVNPNDQAGVVLHRDQVRLTDPTGWNTLGMRGTSSSGHTISADFEEWQILPDSFSTVSSETMLPWSHVLWSAVWTGIATEALRRARRSLSAAGATDTRLADAHSSTSAIRAQTREAAAFLDRAGAARESLPISMTLRLNELKLNSSRQCLNAALTALEICGMRGYAEQGEFSVSRMVRDLLSAPLMVSNRRLLEANSAILSTGRISLK
ncbi:acyl-CoA dehydrogenase family protein [Nonomuraea africana]|uniref:acyl-CoA dehydrogenase family protein n=1 Tax=Nonomuraea africana TaxID=46171 RepID=UPI0033EC7A99